MNIRLAFLVCFLSSLFCHTSIGQEQGATQEQPPRFGVGVNFVQVDVVVTDAEGNRVTDLGPGDFEIFEAGEAQAISSFRVVDIPVEQTVVAPLPCNDVGFNELSREGRVYVLVLDSWHTPPDRSGRVRRTARQFIEQSLAPEDVAAVVLTGPGGTSQSFTSNRALLIEAVDSFQGTQLPSPTIAELEKEREEEQRRSPLTGALPVGSDDKSPDQYDMERASRARQTLETLRDVSASLREIEARRKGVLYIGEGIDYDIYGLHLPTEVGGRIQPNIRPPAGPEIADDLRQVVAEASRSNTAIYSLDSSGLVSGGQRIDEVGGAPIRYGQGLRLYAERYYKQDNLRILSQETGGVAILNENDYTEGFRRIVEDTSHYYLLGYYPTNQDLDGEYREIQVKVNRPDLTVRARKGYVASLPGRAGKADTAEKGLYNPMELTEIPLRVAAGAQKLSGRKPRVPIIVEMGIDGFHFSKEEETLLDRVELAAIALDKQGGVVASEARRLDISVSSRVRDLMLRHGFRAMSRLDLPPGEYQLRVMAREEGAGRKGTVFLDVAVPDCNSRSLAMGGVFLGSLRQSFIPVYIEPEEKGGFAFVPSTVRSFMPDDELLVQTEVCPCGEALIVETDVRDSNGSLLSRDAKSYESGDATIVHRTRVPLDDLHPGSYVLHLSARDRAGGGEAVRQIAFEIVP